MPEHKRPVRRLKTYTAQTGLVYQYVFVGQRPALPGEAAGTEYIFDVSSDRKLKFAVSVFLLDDALAAWAAAHGRSLAEAERYAAAKMLLLRSFDDVEDMLSHGRRLTADAATLENLLSELGVD